MSTLLRNCTPISIQFTRWPCHPHATTPSSTRGLTTTSARSSSKCSPVSTPLVGVPPPPAVSPIGNPNALATAMKPLVSGRVGAFSSTGKTMFPAINETQQESLLPSQIHRGSSFKEKKLTPPPLKTDSVEMENIMVSPQINSVPAARNFRCNVCSCIYVLRLLFRVGRVKINTFLTHPASGIFGLTTIKCFAMHPVGSSCYSHQTGLVGKREIDVAVAMETGCPRCTPPIYQGRTIRNYLGCFRCQIPQWNTIRI